MWEFKQAHWYHPGRQSGPLRFIVIHDMEALDGPNTAEGCMNYFARSTIPPGSSHINIDQNSITQSNRIANTAFGAPGVNHNGIHVELAGFARDSRDEWLKHEGLLNLAACACAELVTLFHWLGAPFEIMRLSPDNIVHSQRSGFIGHIDATNAFHTSGGHTDPGTGFPWDIFLPKVQWWLPHINHIDFV